MDLIFCVLRNFDDDEVGGVTARAQMVRGV